MAKEQPTSNPVPDSQALLEAPILPRPFNPFLARSSLHSPFPLYWSPHSLPPSGSLAYPLISQKPLTLMSSLPPAHLPSLPSGKQGAQCCAQCHSDHVLPLRFTQTLDTALWPLPTVIHGQIPFPGEEVSPTGPCALRTGSMLAREKACPSPSSTHTPHRSLSSASESSTQTPRPPHEQAADKSSEDVPLNKHSARIRPKTPNCDSGKQPNSVS